MRVIARAFGNPEDQFVYQALEATGDSVDMVHKGQLYDAFTRFCHFTEADETPVQ